MQLVWKKPTVGIKSWCNWEDESQIPFYKNINCGEENEIPFDIELKAKSLNLYEEWHDFFNESKNSSKQFMPKYIFKFRELLNKLKYVLNGPQQIIVIPNIHYLTSLQCICWGLTEYENKMYPYKKDQILIHDEFTLEEYSMFRRKVFVEFGRGLMYSRDFCKLENRDRVLLFNNLVNVFGKLAIAFFSLRVFGHEDPCNLTLILNTQAGGGTSFRMVGEVYSEPTIATISNLFKKSSDVFMDQIYLPMKKIPNFEMIEFSFLIGQYLWSTDCIDGLSAEAIILSKKVLTSLNNDIHNYYSNLNLTNYVLRLTEIIKLTTGVMKHTAVISDIITQARVFEMFEVGEFYFEKMKIDNPHLIYLMS
uniref:NR LBD domain-containing protein n=1 Tax=Rhabditophanes sp. KR3021 TaxID=114890 RepID=A0AC35TVS5_9BILA